MTDDSTSWWPSLHDGYLERFASSVDERTVTLAVRIDHLAEDPGSGWGSRFAIRLNVVRAVHVTAWEPWGALDTQDREAFNRALLQGRMVSIQVEDFAGSGLRITDATVYDSLAKDLVWPIATFTEPETALKLLTLNVDGSESEEIGDRGIAVIFDNAEVFREGRPLTAEEFLGLGESFWRKFRERAEQQEVSS